MTRNLAAGSLLALLASACFGVPCPDSAPLYCPTAGKCCQADTPWHCGETCYASQASATSACGTTGAVEQCKGNAGSGSSTGYQQCTGSTPLYCNSYAGPQLLQGVPGECCSVGTGATSQIGYLCGYTGSNGVPTTSSGGVCNGFSQISSGCPSYGTVIRCCGGGPC